MSTPASIANVGGRAAAIFQSNHVIPFELWGGRHGTGTKVLLIELFEEFGGTAANFDLDGFDNRQRLPAEVLEGGSAIHRGSHPGMTTAVRERLDNVANDFVLDNVDDIAAARGGDAAAQTRLRNALTTTLRDEVNNLKFRATNFMDDAASAGNRMIFNGRDLAYLQQTQTWATATEAERLNAIRRSPTDLILRHNERVLSTQLSAARELEFKVLKDFGAGTVADYGGTAAERNGIRALISEAQARGVNLMSSNAVEFANVIELEFENSSAVRTLTQQIDTLTTQIDNASGAARDALIAQRQALEDSRFARYGEQVLGRDAARISAQTWRSGLVTMMRSTSAGRALTEAGEFLLKRVGAKLIPGLNIILTAKDIWDVSVWSYDQLMTHSPGFRGFASDVYHFFTGKKLDTAVYIKDPRGNCAAAFVCDDMIVVTVTATRGASVVGDGDPYTYYTISPLSIKNQLGKPPSQVTIAELASAAQIGLQKFYPDTWGGPRIIGRYYNDNWFGYPDQEPALTGFGIKRNADGTTEVLGFEQRQGHSGEGSAGAFIDTPDVGGGSSGEGVFITSEERSIFDANGNLISSSGDASVETSDNSATGDPARQRFEGTMAAIGGVIGSTLAAQLDIDSPWLAIPVSTVMSTLGSNIAHAIASPTYSMADAFNELPADIKAAGLGAIGSYLWGELVNDLGLNNFWTGALTAAGGAAIAQIASNLLSTAPGVTWSSGVGSAMANGVGAFVGAYLASELVTFYTKGGQIGASVGAAIGGAVGGYYGGPLGAAVGAFFGYILGGAIGSMINGDPKAGVALSWDASTHQIESTGEFRKNGGSLAGPLAVADAVRNTLEGIIGQTGSQLVDGNSVRFGDYRIQNRSFKYVARGADGKNYTVISSSDGAAVVKLGTLVALADMLPRLAGGDVFSKRALAASLARMNIDPNNIPLVKWEVRYRTNQIVDTTTLDIVNRFDASLLFGNLQIAAEYGAFLRNSSVIGQLMSLEPESAFTAVWTATIASAIDLGLNRRSYMDWTGGWTVFLDEAADGRIGFDSIAAGNLSFAINEDNGERIFQFVDGNGDSIGVLGDTIDSELKNYIVANDSANNIIISGNSVQNTNGLEIDGVARTGAPFAINIAARIFGEGGNDTIVVGDLGNDASGGDGNDTLVGGKLDDWLFGDAGDDRLFAAQPSNYQFADSDAAAVAAALATSSNGDMLDGGAGNDLLYGSRGSDWLRGGDGSDILRGGDGADVLEGGAGDERGSSGEARLLGGAGNDQYVFNYGDGVDVVFDESSPGSSSGSVGDSMYNRISNINAGIIPRDWVGGGDYEANGVIKGGEDAIAFGPGITLADIKMHRSGTQLAPGQDLIIELTWLDPVSGVRYDTGDRIEIKDWFESTRRVEWLRFANGEELRIGAFASYVIGTGGSDMIIGTDQADYLYGGQGNDTMFGLMGDDFGFGGEGNDMVSGDEDNDMVSGGSGNDMVVGGLGNDTVFGDAGDDTLYGGGGADLLSGGMGEDLIVTGAGNDVVNYRRGEGRDTLLDAYIDNWETVWLNGSYVNGYVLDQATGTVSKNGVQVFDGMRWNGVYDYTDSTLTLRRHLGAVGGVLAANSGTDTLAFDVGIDIQDLMLRKNGNDLQIAVSNIESDQAFDTVSDRITLTDAFTAGNSIEWFTFVATGHLNTASITMPGTGTDGADNLVGTAGADWITGNAGDDIIAGDAGADILNGNGGNDSLRGDAGIDVLYGGSGDDVLNGGTETDVLIGGFGVDIASYANSTVAVRAFLNAPGSNSGEGLGDAYNSIEGLEGSAFNDRLGGDSGDNVLRGLAGNDTLMGGAGDDTYEIDASNGQDTINESVFSTEEIVSANGTLNTALYNFSWTYLGTTTISSGATRKAFRLVITRIGSGEEVYRSVDFTDYLFNTSVSNSMALPAASSWVHSRWNTSLGVMRSFAGSQINNQLVVRDIVNTTQDGGYDTLEFGAGIGLSDLTFTRPTATDVRITYGSSQYVTLQNQTDQNRSVDVLSLRDGLAANLNFLVLVGETASAEGDLVVGDSAANTLNGLAGDDVLSGMGGADVLNGGDGNDILEGGAGGDTLNGGSDSVSLGAPIDAANPGSYGDTIRYVRSTAGVTIDLAARTASGGHAASDTITQDGAYASIENVVGSEGFGDTLRGDARANRLAGLGGNDTLEGRAGNDMLAGNAGNDILRGGDGDDNITGDDGDDTLEGGNNNDFLSGGAGIDTMTGDAGDDVLIGGDGNDIMHGNADNDTMSGDGGNDQMWGDAGVDEIDGGDGDDTVSGGDGDDRLYGSAGSDQLAGDLGNDKLDGGDGNDTLSGGDGNDTLTGGTGNDSLSGDAGDDTYIFDASSGSDVIVDSAGTNGIVFKEVNAANLWITRSGNDLRIGVIGGAPFVTVQGYYASTSPTRIASITVGERVLDLATAAPLIAAMTAHSTSVPSARLPDALAGMIDDYWNGTLDTSPVVTNQVLSTNEDTVLNGSVAATDPNNNITGYTVHSAPTHGTLNLNATTGAWSFTPATNYWGSDAFQVRVTDADGNTATQTVSVTINSVNDAPTAINASGLVTSINERDKPVLGSPSPAIVLATLSVTDPDAPDPGDFASHTYSVNNSAFEVVGGQLRLRAGVALDYETATSASVTVTATDRNGAGLSVARTFTFAVNNQDDYFYGTSGNDTITGTAGVNQIFGQGGNDTLNGAGANDTLDGGDGNDTLNGLGGNDTLLGQVGDDILDGGLGNDTLRGGDGVDTLRGSDGADLLYGDAGNDTLQGGIGDDILEGGDHNDQLEGGDGNDTLRGQNGDDTLIGGLGGDRFNGGAGTDTVSYAAATAGVTLSLAAGTGTAGEASGDVFEDAIERVIGSAFADTITGSAGIDYIEGGAGNDVIYGGAGDDVLLGGDGNDTIDAQAGDDTLDGGLGSDILIGGVDNDTYRMDVNSGADEIRNFDPNGVDIDVIAYDGIVARNLWFEKSGNDLIVTAVGTNTRTTIKDWYVVASATDRANYKIDFFVAGVRSSNTINAEALVTLMANYTRPTTVAQYDSLHNTNSTFESGWNAGWNLNRAPTIATIGTQGIGEDGAISNLALSISDDITPLAGLSVTAQLVNPSNYGLPDTSGLMNAPTVSLLTDAQGNRYWGLSATTQQNRSGQTAIMVTASDGSLSTSQVFLVNITPAADAPGISGPVAAAPTAPATKRTFDGGPISLSLDAWLNDTDGSETLEIRIAGVPSGINFVNGSGVAVGSLQGDGSWLFTRAQLSGLRLNGPASWSQDFTLNVTATTRETANGSTATATSSLAVEINARPTLVTADRTLSFAENTAVGTPLAWFGRNDADGAGDGATYEALSTAGNRWTVRSDGLLSVGSAGLDYESVANGVTSIDVRVTDSGGLTRTDTFTINITNVNEAPTGISTSTGLSFNEGLAAGTALATFTRSDPDNDGYTFSLVDNAGGRYSIDSNGVLRSGSTTTNYDSPTNDRSHTITVRVTDSGNLSYQQNFTISVLPVNEAPSITNASSTFTVSENAVGFGNVLKQTDGTDAKVTGSDPEGVALKYELTAGDTSVFSIDQDGTLRLQGVLDWDLGRRTYSVTATAWDGGALRTGNAVNRTFTINVVDFNESPTYSGYTNDTNRNDYVIGTVAFTDPEGGALTYSISSAFWCHGRDMEFGGVIGEWDDWYGGNLTINSAGKVVMPTGMYYETQGDGWNWYREVYALYGQFSVTARDSAGNVSQALNVYFDVGSSHVMPVVFDLDGDGLELVALQDSKVSFDMSNDGMTMRTGWVGADDALLALDRDGDGQITHGAEISFVGDSESASTDLEGLVAFDTNHNDMLDAGDERFGEFRLWQDMNQDGISDAGELRSLTEANIGSLSLVRTHTGNPVVEGQNLISATADYQRLDGSWGVAGDVSLAYQHLQTQVLNAPTEDEAAPPTEGVDRSASNPEDEAKPYREDPNPPDVVEDTDENGPIAAQQPRRRAAAHEALRQAARSLRERPWRKPDFGLDQDVEGEWQPEELPRAGALHSPLGLVARRKLQMIDALATFSPESAAELELRPQRRVDSRTLELLTSVGNTWNN